MCFKGSLFPWTSHEDRLSGQLALLSKTGHCKEEFWKRGFAMTTTVQRISKFHYVCQGDKKSEARKMGGHKFAGCAVEKKTHFCLGNVTALDLRNYLVSLS